MDAHAKFSASASERWLACPGSIALSAGRESSTSEYAAEGTLAHRLFEAALLGKRKPVDWVGEVHEVDGYMLSVDNEMAEHVQKSVDAVGEVTPAAQRLFFEAERVFHYNTWLNVPLDDAFGTSDCTVLLGPSAPSTPDELQVHDFKYGRGVPVVAENNTQLLLYAGGALLEYEGMADIKTVRMYIHQPRVREAPSEWSISVYELRQWLTGRARSGAASVLNAERLAAKGIDATWEGTFLTAGDHCRWCPAKTDCPTLRNEALSAAFDNPPASPDEFDDLTAPTAPAARPEAWIAAIVGKLDWIEDWAKDVRARALELAQAGTLPGYKAVQGRKGDRAWRDATEAENLLRKVFRLKVEDAYNLKLVSPPQAEKMVKAGVIGQRQWAKAKALIVQPEGKPHLAPADDPRPALRAALSDFDAAPAADDIC